MTTRIDITPNSWLDVISPTVDTNVNFKALWKLHPDTFGQVVIYGKTISTPRWYQSYDEVYTFSGSTHTALPLPDILNPVKDYVNRLGYGTFDQTLINWYENGQHYIGAHSDDERDIKIGSPILSVSLGATRKFRIRSKETKAVVLDVDLVDGSVVVMCGTFQKELKHEIVKVNGKKGLAVGPRINITFRQFKDK